MKSKRTKVITKRPVRRKVVKVKGYIVYLDNKIAYVGTKDPRDDASIAAFITLTEMVGGYIGKCEISFILPHTKKIKKVKK